MKKLFLTAILIGGLLLTGCNANSDPTPPKPDPCSHEYGDYLFDANGHWKECVKCHKKTEVEEHDLHEETLIEPSCVTSGLKSIYCDVCDYSTEVRIDPLDHDWEEAVIVPPTSLKEGSYIVECSRCEEKQEKKILRLPESIKLDGLTISWSEVENAEGYILRLQGEEIDCGGLTSFELSSMDQLEGNVEVYAYTSDDDYFIYDGARTREAFQRGKDNLQSLYNSDFEANSRIRLNRIAGWNNYPYGNWSDLDNSGLGGHYYIEQEKDGNMAALIPAVVWYPGNTTLKRDLGSGCWAAGTYEIRFDIKASEAALTYWAGGNYGHISGYLWNDHGASDLITVYPSGDSFNDKGIVIKDIEGISTTEYTTVRLRYTLMSDVPYNQFNLIYWPEQDVGEQNYILIDNISVHKASRKTVEEENVDYNIGGDFECWNQYEMGNNLWYANNTILPENNALDSKVILEDNNQALKISSLNSSKAQINIAGNPNALGKAGVYEMDIKVKKSDELVDPIFSFTMWGFKGGSPIAMMDETYIDISSAVLDAYTKYTVRFSLSNIDNLDSINIFFTVDFTNDIGSEFNYIIIDDVEIYRLILGEDPTMNILIIGNSHADDTIEYIYKILENLNRDVSDLHIYTLFYGGATIAQHYDFYLNNYSNFDLRAYNKEGGYWYNIQALCSLQTALKYQSSWDIVSFQQASKSYYDFETFNDLPLLANAVRNIVGEKTSFIFNGTWSYTNDAPEITQGLYKNQMDQYNKIIEGEKKVMADNYAVQFDKLIPSTTSIQNARIFFGENGLNRDDRHLTFGLGRFIASLTFVATVFELDISNVTYMPSDVTEDDLEKAILSVKAAIANPYELLEQ